MEYKSIQPSELRVGDVITVHHNPTRVAYSDELYTDVWVTSADTICVKANGLNFYTDHNTFFLVKRVKQPLPTVIGSVVEVDGVKYVRVLEDSEWFYEWAKSVDGNTLDSVSSEYLAELDYTVV